MLGIVIRVSRPMSVIAELVPRYLIKKGRFSFFLTDVVIC